jgi:hypothetical protein
MALKLLIALASIKVSYLANLSSPGIALPEAYSIAKR